MKNSGKDRIFLTFSSVKGYIRNFFCFQKQSEILLSEVVYMRSFNSLTSNYYLLLSAAQKYLGRTWHKFIFSYYLFNISCSCTLVTGNSLSIKLLYRCFHQEFGIVEIVPANSVNQPPVQKFNRLAYLVLHY
jgi:hypothetical protein